MILLCRPAPHLPRTVQALHAAGLDGVIPLAISSIQTLPPRLAGGATVVLTSPHAAGPWLEGHRVIAVGPTTAAAAEDAGATVLHSGAGGAADLLPYLHTLAPQHLVHLHGNTSDCTWHTHAGAMGHRLDAVCTYHTTYAAGLPAAVMDALQHHTIRYVLLFSAGGTNHLQKLLQQATITPSQTAVAFSPQVAAAASAFPRVLTAAQPTLHAMITTLQQSRAT